MLRLRTIAALTSAVLLGASCDEPPTGDESTIRPVPVLDGLRLEVTISQSVIPVGDSATVTMQLHNDNATAMEIYFSTGCQILPYIETASGAMRFPSVGGWACTQALTSLTVPARGSVTRSYVVRGATATDDRNGASLIPGQYRAYALLDAIRSQQQLRSPTISFEIR